MVTLHTAWEKAEKLPGNVENESPNHAIEFTGHDELPEAIAEAIEVLTLELTP